ncbi:efflux RND transporter permease subunit, partial [Staphylococcus aureus]|uniref:efflux RND transporter permease subunit n=2 Tax=Bacteria TaxID=2 RepID=UPI0021484674
RGYADPANVKVRHQGRETIALGVSMTKGGDIIRLGKSLRGAVGDISRTLPAGVELANMQDQPKAVADSVNEFLQVLIEAVVV